MMEQYIDRDLFHYQDKQRSAKCYIKLSNLKEWIRLNKPESEDLVFGNDHQYDGTPIETSFSLVWTKPTEESSDGEFLYEYLSWDFESEQENTPEDVFNSLQHKIVEILNRETSTFKNQPYIVCKGD